MVSYNRPCIRSGSANDEEVFFYNHLSRIHSALDLVPALRVWPPDSCWDVWIKCGVHNEAYGNNCHAGCILERCTCCLRTAAVFAALKSAVVQTNRWLSTLDRNFKDEEYEERRGQGCGRMHP
jgi:hypothetical protein